MARVEHRRGMCVLTFHRVVEDCQADHDITWASFRALLDVIVESGNAIRADLASEEPSRGSVALTFDDATEDHMQAGEELSRRHMTGIFFVPAGKVGMPGRLNLQQVRALHSLGHVVGSHGFWHVPLHKRMLRTELDREFAESKATLEDGVGAKITHFAPPGGLAPELVQREAPKYGYDAARSMRWGIYVSLRARWIVPCIPVTEFTVGRGWIQEVLCTHRLPFAMRSASVIKSVTPGPLRASLRKMLHAPFQCRTMIRQDL